MIPPEIHDRANEDVTVGLDAALHSTQNEEFIRSMLAAVGASAPEYTPDSFDLIVAGRPESRRVPLDKSSVRQLGRALRTNEPCVAFLTQGDPTSVTIMLSSGGKSAVPYDIIGLSVRRDLVTSRAHRKRFVAAAHSIARICDAYLGTFRTWRLKKTTPDGTVVPGALHRGLPPPEWGFLFGRDYVKLVGPDVLRRAPCEVVQELPGGFMLLLLAEDFVALEDDLQHFEEKRELLVRHLGPEYFHYAKDGFPKKVLPYFLEQNSRRGRT